MEVVKLPMSYVQPRFTATFAAFSKHVSLFTTSQQALMACCRHPPSGMD